MIGIEKLLLQVADTEVRDAIRKAFAAVRAANHVLERAPTIHGEELLTPCTNESLEAACAQYGSACVVVVGGIRYIVRHSAWMVYDA